MGRIKDTYGTPETTLANYDWYDLTTGTGYKDFYGMDIREGADALAYVLTTQIYYSTIGYLGALNSVVEVNLDLDFEIPMTMEGVAILNAVIESPHNPSAKTLTFKLYRVDAANAEHQIGSTVTHSVDLNNSVHINSVRFDIPVTRFKAGEKFRLSMSCPAGGAAVTMRWLFDPKDRDVSNMAGIFQTSQLKISLPIRI